MRKEDDVGARVATVGDESPEAVEAAIERSVRRFYDLAHADPLLGPVMRSIVDFEKHVGIVCDFWSHALLGTDRYQGKAYPPHASLPIRPEHFERWLALFSEATSAELSAAHARQAMEKAQHMARSFMAGMFPFEGLDGRDIRRPQIILATRG
jgi:hemoglobin